MEGKLSSPTLVLFTEVNVEGIGHWPGGLWDRLHYYMWGATSQSKFLKLEKYSWLPL